MRMKKNRALQYALVGIVALICAGQALAGDLITKDDGVTGAGTPPSSTWAGGHWSDWGVGEKVLVVNGNDGGYVYTYQEQTLGGPTYQHRWIASAIQNSVTVSTGGTIRGTGTALIDNAVGAKNLTLSGGSIKTSVGMQADATWNNLFTVTSGTLSTGQIVDVGKGTITINTAGTVDGNIVTSGAGLNANGDNYSTVLGANNINALVDGSSTWNIQSGTINGNLTSFSTAGDVFNIGNTAPSLVTLTNTKTLSVASNSIVNFGGDNTNKANMKHAEVDDYTVATTGGGNQIRIRGYSDFTANSSVVMDGSTKASRNLLEISLYDHTPADAHRNFDGDVTINGEYNTLIVGGKTQVTNATNITIGAGAANNTYTFTDSSIFDADWKAMAGDNHLVEIKNDHTFSGWQEYTGQNITVNVHSDKQYDSPTMSGQIVFDQDAAGGTNKVYISSGELSNFQGSFIGSNNQKTEYYVSSSPVANPPNPNPHYNDPVVTMLVSGGEATKYQITGGQVHNIQARVNDGANLNQGGGARPNDYLANYEAKDNVKGLDHTALFYNDKTSNPDGQKYQSYAILNLKELNVAGHKTLLTIGNMNTTNYNITNQTGYVAGSPPSNATTSLGNQLTADKVTVDRVNKLVIHEDGDLMGVNQGQTWWQQGGTNQEKRNVVNDMQVYGELTIDRTTLYGTATGGTLSAAKVTVNAGGVIHGFGEWDTVLSPDNHNPLRAQIVGDLILERGSVIQPYDGQFFLSHDLNTADDLTDYALFKTVREDWRGVVFEVTDTNHGAAVAGTGGSITFKQGVEMRGRLFAWDADQKVDLHGYTSPMDTYYSDSLKSLTATFGDIWDGVSDVNKIKAAEKVQYVPVYGFHYDLKSKQEFEIFQGTKDAGDEQTYYYSVLNGRNTITELVDQADANHLFNRDILRSDMLGNYMFLKKENNDGVYLRYRMIANHPTQGGIPSVAGDKNNIKPGQYLDEIRYPFRHPGTDLQHLPDDPSAGFGYNKAGYNGDMISWYANPVNNQYFDNYTDDYIRDWDLMFRGMQLHVTSAWQMNRAMAQLNGEMYAAASGSNLNAMNQFIMNRERNSVSAMFQVESSGGAAGAGSDEALASLSQAPVMNAYVSNPFRFWASGFGSQGRMHSASGIQGYSSDTWGGSVGAIKELGDSYFGATIGVANTKDEWNTTIGSIDTWSYMAEVLYGKRVFDLGFLEVHGNYSFNEHKSSRGINFAGYYVTSYKANFDDHVAGGGIRFGYQKVLGQNWLLVPTIGVTAMHSWNNGFSERGSGGMGLSPRLEFRKGSMDRTVIRTPITVRLSRSVAMGENWMFAPEVRAGFSPILGDRRGKVEAKFAGNPTNNRWFTTEGGNKGAYEASLGTTLEFSRKGRFYLAGNYDFLYSPKSIAHNFSLQAGWGF